MKRSVSRICEEFVCKKDKQMNRRMADMSSHFIEENTHMKR